MVIELLVTICFAAYAVAVGVILCLAMAKVQVAAALLATIGEGAHNPNPTRIRDSILAITALEAQIDGEVSANSTKEIRAKQIYEVTEIYRSYVKNDVTFRFVMDFVQPATRANGQQLARVLQHWMERTSPTEKSRPTDLTVRWPTRWYPAPLRRFVIRRSNLAHERGFVSLLVKCYGHQDLAAMANGRP